MTTQTTRPERLSHAEYWKMVDAAWTAEYERDPSRFYEWFDLEYGQELDFPAAFLFPNALPTSADSRKGETEWDLAAPGKSTSTDPIRVRIQHDRFTVRDGHNRLKDAIADGKTNVRIVIESGYQDNLPAMKQLLAESR